MTLGKTPFFNQLFLVWTWQSKKAIVKNVLEKLLNEIDVRHNHSSAAVTLATKLVHRLTKTPSQHWSIYWEKMDVNLPVGNLFKELEITLPEIANDLCRR